MTARFELKLFLLLTVPVAALMFMHYLLTGFVVYNDGRGYSMYLRSAVIDRDINFTNEWEYYNTLSSGFSEQKRAVNFPLTTQTGYLENIYLIGNALMWAPLYILTHLASIALAGSGLPVSTDGFGAQYEFSIGISSLIYGFIGVWLVYKFCKKWFDQKTALIATIALWYGTAWFWYHSIEPSMAHMNSIFLVALFTHLWHGTLEKRTKIQWTALGFLLGLITLVRQQEILMAALPIFEISRKIIRKFEAREITSSIFNGSLITLGFLLVFIPQMLVWKAMYGSYITYSYGSSATTEYWYWTMPQILPLIFSAEAGLWRVPTTLLAIAGLFLFARRVKGVAWLFLAVALAQIILVSSWTGWSVSYGVRYLLGISIFLVLGAAEMVKIVKARAGIKYVYALVAMLIIGNFMNMLAVMLTEITSRIPMDDIIKILKGKFRL